MIKVLKQSYKAYVYGVSLQSEENPVYVSSLSQNHNRAVICVLQLPEIQGATPQKNLSRSMVPLLCLSIRRMTKLTQNDPTRKFAHLAYHKLSTEDFMFSLSL